MTYAGYQRYETPNLGAVAVEQIDKQKALDLKQQELDRAQKYKDDTLAAKNKAAQDKIDQANAKQDAENAKLIDVKEKEFQSSVIETGSVITSPDADGLFTNFSNTQLKPEVIELTRKLTKKEIDQQGFNAGLNAITSGVKGVGETFKTFEAAIEKINTNANSNPLEQWVANSVYNEVVPSEDNQKALMKDADGVYYVQNSKGDRHDISVLKSVTALTQHPVINFDEDAKKNVIELIPKNSTETLRKGGGTQTDIDQLKNDKFEKFANTWINKVTSDAYSAANAYRHYMNDGNVAFIKKGASEEERKTALLSLGVDENKLKENEKYLVEVSFDNKNKVPMPILTKEQKAELKKEMKSSVTAMAVKSKAISMPSTTTVNITSQAQAQSQADDLVQGVRNNEAGWVDTFKTLARRAGRIIPTGTIKDANGVDHEVVSYNPTTKIMTVYSEQGKSGTTVSWQPEYIDMNNEKQARTKIASLIKAAEVTSNTAATLPPITR
jgi:hypothetical protein